jgi:hypothetical protein
MRAFVTGSAGLLGNNLVCIPHQAGHEVWAPVQDLRTFLYACRSHPKMLYRVAAINRSVTDAGVFPF